jgi:transcription initiation factor TFIIIB Brf1 subunit/transcription initiation factor TFIIB
MNNFALLEEAVAACSSKTQSTSIEKNIDIGSDQVEKNISEESSNLTNSQTQYFDAKCTVTGNDHSIIISNGNKVCEHCGVELPREIDNTKEWRYYGAQDTRHNGDPSRCHMRKVEERTINKDVENMGFSDKIIEKANTIYEQVSGGKIYRGNSRKAIIFACIFHAYKLAGEPQPCDTLIEIFNLEKKVGLRGLKHVNLKIPANSAIKSTYITPEHLITDIMNKFEASKEQKDEVITLYKSIANRSSILNRSRPQSVASGIVRYYILANGKEISMSEFRAKVNLSELTINRIVREIGNLLGNPNII